VAFGVMTAEVLDAPTLRELAAVIEIRAPAMVANLRHRAALIDGRDWELVARRSLSPEGRERLADIYLAGSIPTIGFWRRELAES
jgi:hypothetical protein